MWSVILFWVSLTHDYEKELLWIEIKKVSWEREGRKIFVRQRRYVMHRKRKWWTSIEELRNNKRAGGTKENEKTRMDSKKWIARDVGSKNQYDLGCPFYKMTCVTQALWTFAVDYFWETNWDGECIDKILEIAGWNHTRACRRHSVRDRMVSIKEMIQLLGWKIRLGSIMSKRIMNMDNKKKTRSEG